MEVLCDAPAHRKPDQMRPFDLEAVQHAHCVTGEIAEIERTFVVLGFAVAARIPGNRVE